MKREMSILISLLIFVSLLILTVILVNYYKFKNVYKPEKKNKFKIFISVLIASIIDFFGI